MTTYYVATTGNDSANGSSATPWKTISNAMKSSDLKAGDTIIVRPGTYVEPYGVTMKAGSAAGDITLKSETRGEAKITTTAFAAVYMANYTTIEGFDLKAGSHGIFNNEVHHITMRNNIAHECSEAGMGAMHSDFVTIDGNECWGNCSATWGSGISIYEPWNLTGDMTTTTPRIIIRNNICHHNVTLPEGGPHTDGNGIIMDDFQNWQNAPNVDYLFGALIENNLCYSNGGKGIAVHWSNNVTVRRNTCIGNNLDKKNDATWRGEFSQQDCFGAQWESNLGVPDASINPANTGIGYYGNVSDTQWVGNAVSDAAPNLGGASGPLPGSGNLFNVNPQLVDYEPTNPALANIGWRSTGVIPVDPPVTPPEETPLPYHVNMLFSGISPIGAPIAGEGPYELGTTFRVAEAGTIKALRLWRISTNPGVSLRLWKGSTLLVTKSIASGATGWVEAAVNIAVAAGDEVVVSWGMAAGKAYAATNDMFGAEVKAGPLSVPVGGGVFATATGQRPTQVWHNSYYWTDLRLA